MTPRQVELVKSSFDKVRPIADDAAGIFYDRLFHLDPSLRPLFRGDMRDQGRKLMQMIGVVVGSLHRLDTILPAARDLGRRHVRYGVEPRHYETVGGALLHALEQGLGPEFTAEVRGAWTSAYTTLSRAMIEAASAPESSAA
jgi:nitric oxide dioxygenase